MFMFNCTGSLGISKNPDCKVTRNFGKRNNVYIRKGCSGSILPLCMKTTKPWSRIILFLEIIPKNVERGKTGF
jgi:hypothetical protein